MFSAALKTVFTDQAAFDGTEKHLLERDCHEVEAGNELHASVNSDSEQVGEVGECLQLARVFWSPVVEHLAAVHRLNCEVDGVFEVSVEEMEDGEPHNQNCQQEDLRQYILILNITILNTWFFIYSSIYSVLRKLISSNVQKLSVHFLSAEAKKQKTK